MGMEAIVEGVFLLGGNVVSQLGVIMSILLIGLAPIYCYLLVRPHLKPRGVGVRRVYFGLSVLVAAVLTSILAICGIVLGAWG